MHSGRDLNTEVLNKPCERVVAFFPTETTGKL